MDHRLDYIGVFFTVSRAVTIFNLPVGQCGVSSLVAPEMEYRSDIESEQKRKSKVNKHGRNM
jgi:hypothetical protein